MPKELFEQWIDTFCLDEEITETLEDEHIRATACNKKKLWLNFLETELAEGLKRSLRALIDNSQIE